MAPLESLSFFRNTAFGQLPVSRIFSLKRPFFCFAVCLGLESFNSFTAFFRDDFYVSFSERVENRPLGCTCGGNFLRILRFYGCLDGLRDAFFDGCLATASSLGN